MIEAGEEAVRRGAEILSAGGLVAFPTETVYGLGADATDDAAVGRIFGVKGRPTADPLIVHLPSIREAARWGELGVGRGDGLRLAREFWPGPLTLVVPRRPGLSDLVGKGLATVGLRVPAHPVALELLRATDGPVAAPSANRFGRVSPTTAGHVVDELGDRIDLVIDGGSCPLGVESTVVILGEDPPQLLRPGGLVVEDLRSVVPDLVVPDGEAGPPEAPAVSPGTMLAHYAPSVPLTLVDARRTVTVELLAAVRAEGLEVVELRLPDDPVEAAGILYSALRGLDSGGGELALATALDGTGLGRAVNDRLFRAAHGHVVSECDADSVGRILARVRSR